MNTLDYIIIGAIIGIFLSLYGLKLLKRWKFKRRLSKARAGEIKAVDLVKRHGFNVVDLQKEESYTLFIDKKPHTISVRADMIVKKGTKTYVAEVKTGNKVTSPTHTQTRRQLLEYFIVYRPYGLLLVDMDKQKIRTVEYSILKRDLEVLINRWLWIAIVFVGGFIVGFLTRGG